MKTDTVAKVRAALLEKQAADALLNLISALETADVPVGTCRLEIGVRRVAESPKYIGEFFGTVQVYVKEVP